MITLKRNSRSKTVFHTMMAKLCSESVVHLCAEPLGKIRSVTPVVTSGGREASLIL